MSAPDSGAPIAFLGAGSLGTALAAGLWRTGRRFRLWTIEEDVAESLLTYRENVKYLPGIKIAKEVEVTLDLDEALDGAGIVVLTIPSHVIREVTARAAAGIAPGAIVVSAAKGLEQESLLRMSQVVASELPEALRSRIVVFSGPSLAPEVARGVPTGVDVAADDPELARAVKVAFSARRFKLKVKRDVAGVEAGGTFKNLYAIGAGVLDGMGLGNNTKSAMLVKALTEMTACARALGGRASTLHGLSGLGDLVVTCTSAHSRNRTLGEHLGRGHRVADITRGMVGVTEGVDAARAAHELAARKKLRLPLADAILKVLNGDEKPEAIARLSLP